MCIRDSLDADDYIEPDYFELLCKKVLADKADVVFIDVIQETPEGKLLRHETMSSFSKYTVKDMIGYQMTGYMPVSYTHLWDLRGKLNKTN